LVSINRIGRIRRLKAGQRIVSENDAPDFFAVIVSGSIKLTKNLSDGRQQIVGLLFPSDFVGQPMTSHATCNVEAATDVWLCTYPIHQFDALLQQFPESRDRIYQVILQELTTAQEWMLLLGCKTAREKVASFLLMVARQNRAIAVGNATTEILLPLSREEIGEFIGLRAETVSRQLHQLADETIVHFTGRRKLTVVDGAKLEAAAAGTLV
jgi:CRP/FNR family transcriptional regulator